MYSIQSTANADRSPPNTANSTERNSNSSALDTNQITRVGQSALGLVSSEPGSSKVTMIKLKSGKEVPEGTYKITTMILGQFLKTPAQLQCMNLLKNVKQ
ncbi:hypothetical protein GTU79_08220 [Sodalis ligni]|uniref:hypothetical protein n=1 Tax=Sodalis ligni TaxID=2697027 RepID=UPI001BDE839A|nr:hypothetical protein [Sodalis ligni]QWA12682.1 hypothetical protein GTU79_08220 [Sodalis ligni]